MRKRGRERGQILPIAALALVALLGVGAFGIDVGYAYYAKRQLQSATDAAALAGAQDLPSVSTAKATAATYASANVPANLSTVTFTYTTSCTTAATAGVGCSATTNPNNLTVTATASTNTWFAKIFGLGKFDVAARANACSPCSSSPVDVVVVLDRTGSMCDNSRPDRDGCTDLDNAKEGVHTLLSILNPPYAQVGMIAFPPLDDASTPVCNAPQGTSSDYTAYDSADRRYLTDQIGSDYKLSNGNPNASSGLYLHTAAGDDTKCVRPDGYTSYSEALRQAKQELDTHGRVDIPDVIVFLTDGEANIGSVYASDGRSYTTAAGKKSGYGTSAFPDNSAYPPGNSDDEKPCQTAEDLATSYKDAGIRIYSIGYALGTSTKCTTGDYGPWIPAQAQMKSGGKVTQVAIPAHWCDRDSTAQVTLDSKKSYDTEKDLCYHKADVGNESPTIYSDDTVEDIASDGAFYNKSAGGDLTSIFSAIATDIGSGSSRLVDDGY